MDIYCISMVCSSFDSHTVSNAAAFWPPHPAHHENWVYLGGDKVCPPKREALGCLPKVLDNSSKLVFW